MQTLFTTEIIASLVTLTFLEIILGIDNIIFISILSDALPESQRNKARQTGLALAMLMRIGLLLSIKALIGLEGTIISLFGFDFSGSDLILLGGGIFLIAKSTSEIHEKLEGKEGHAASNIKVTFSNVVFQILLLDVVFSLDSVITAVGMADEIWVMVTAVIIAVIIMIFTVNQISDFINRHPTVKMLALSFLLLIGFTLVTEGLGHHVEKSIIYSAIAFSVFVEFLNTRLRDKVVEPVSLRDKYSEEESTN